MSEQFPMFSNYSSTKEHLSFDFQLPIEFESITSVVGNTLRRMIISEIPTISFEDDSQKHFGFLESVDKVSKQILIRKNRSNLHNEFIAHRLSLLPISFQDKEYIQIISHFDDSLGRRIYYFQNPESLPYFSLKIKNNQEQRTTLQQLAEVNQNSIGYLDNTNILVTADLITVHNSIKEEDTILNYIHPCRLETGGIIYEQYPLLHKLKENLLDSDRPQELDIEMYLSCGIGRYTSRYCPVGTVAYSFKPETKIDFIKEVFENKIRHLEKDRLSKQADSLFTTEDKTIIWDGDDSLDTLMVIAPKSIQSLWNNFKLLDKERVYQTTEKGEPKVIQFAIESVGGIPENNIVYTALISLTLKLKDVIRAIQEDIQKYVVFSLSNSLMGGVDMTIYQENHTLGNLLSAFLQISSDIGYSAYKMLHPLREEIVIRIQPLSSLEDESLLIEQTKGLVIDQIKKLISLLSNMTNQWIEVDPRNESCKPTFIDSSEVIIKKSAVSQEFEEEFEEEDSYED